MAGAGLHCISHHDWCAHLIAILGNAIWVVALGDGCDALPQDQPVSICDSIMSCGAASSQRSRACSVE